jgi:steroid delta-isomerase-like uncharacterized protein
MSATATIARRWFEEVWNDRRDAAIDELMAADSRGHVEGQEVEGPAAFRQMMAMFVGALPDLRIEIEDIIADGDRAAVRWRAAGTHGGHGFGFPATQRPVDIRGTTWLRVSDGKIVEGWDTWNLGGLLEALRAG